MLRATLVVLIASLFTTASFSLTKPELDALNQTVREMCLLPDRQGDYLKVEGEAKAGLDVPVRLVKGDLAGKISYDSWKGIPITLDKYKTDPRQCAIEMVKLLVPTFQPAPVPNPVKTGLDSTQSRDISLLLGYDAAYAIARAKVGEDISQAKATLDERLRLLNISNIVFPQDPMGESKDAEPAADFARRVSGALGARSSALERSFQLGWVGVISSNTPSLSFSGFSVPQFARQAGFRWKGTPKDSELLERLVAAARNSP